MIKINAKDWNEVWQSYMKDLKIANRDKTDTYSFQEWLEKSFPPEKEEPKEDSYRSEQIERIEQPLSPYGYQVQLNNSAKNGKKTKWLRITGAELQKIKELLRKEIGCQE